MNREKQLTYEGAGKKRNGRAETGFMYYDFRLVANPISSAVNNSH